MSCGSIESPVRGFRLVNRRSAYGLRPTARELRPKQPGVGRTQDKRPQGSQQAPSCMTSIRRWPEIATCLTIIRPFPAKLAPEGGLNGYLLHSEFGIHSTFRHLHLRLRTRSGRTHRAAAGERSQIALLQRLATRSSVHWLDSFRPLRGFGRMEFLRTPFLSSCHSAARQGTR